MLVTFLIVLALIALVVFSIYKTNKAIRYSIGGVMSDDYPEYDDCSQCGETYRYTQLDGSWCYKCIEEAVKNADHVFDTDSDPNFAHHD